MRRPPQPTTQSRIPQKVQEPIWGVSQNCGCHVTGPNNKDYNIISRSIQYWGPPILGNYHITKCKTQWNLLDHLVWSLGLKGLVVPKGPGIYIMYGTAAKLLFPEWRNRYVDRIEKCPYTWGAEGFLHRYFGFGYILYRHMNPVRQISMASWSIDM